MAGPFSSRAWRNMTHVVRLQLTRLDHHYYYSLFTIHWSLSTRRLGRNIYLTQLTASYLQRWDRRWSPRHVDTTQARDQEAFPPVLGFPPELGSGLLIHAPNIETRTPGARPRPRL
jgi:hypothetical protein